MSPRHPVEKSMTRFLQGPVTVRSASRVIVVSTTLIVVISGLLMRLLDHDEYPNIFIGMWWAVQTVTTVGYGDVTPKSVPGRIVASVVMLEGIAIVAILTAAITSTFVARAARVQAAVAEGGAEKGEELDRARFDELTARLDRLEGMVRELRDR